MTETAPASSEVSTADKRTALRNAGIAVASRGKLSATAEQQYAELVAQGRARV